MLKTVALKLLSMAVKVLIDANLFQAIQDLVVIAADNTNLTGAEKKELVKQRLETLRGDLAIAFKKTSGSLINFAIESAVVIFKGNSGV